MSSLNYWTQISPRPYLSLYSWFHPFSTFHFHTLNENAKKHIFSKTFLPISVILSLIPTEIQVYTDKKGEGDCEEEFSWENAPPVTNSLNL